MLSGNRILDQYDQDGIVTPGFKRALDLYHEKAGKLLGQPTPQPGPLATPTQAPSSGPLTPAKTTTTSLGPLAAPPQSTVSTPLQAEHSRLTAPPIQEGPLAHTKADTGRSGIGQIHNPWLRGLATIGDVIGTGFFPRAAQAIPGTTLHHRMLVQENEGAQHQEEANKTAEAARAHLGAETTELGAKTGHENAETDALKNPVVKEKQEDEQKTIETSEGIMKWNPQTKNYDIPVGKPPLKEGQNIHVLPDGSVVAVHHDPKSGHSSAEVVYKGDPKVPTHVVQLEMKGKPHQVLVNSATGEQIKDLGESGEKPAKPPNFGVTLVTPDGQVKRVQPGQSVEPGSMTANQYGSLFTPSGQTKSRAEQGTAVIEAGHNLIKMIDDPKYNKVFGNLGSYWDQFINQTPISDPAASRMMSELASYAALQPALHGFRSHDALKEFAKIIGGIPKNAESVKEAIRGIEDTARVVQKGGRRGGSEEPKVRKYNPATGRLE